MTTSTAAKTKTINYGQALHEAMMIAMEKDETVICMGIGVDDHKAVFGSTKDLVEKFGKHRVFDTPIAEAGMTGIAAGAAIAGIKPVHIHIRVDFTYLAMDQIFNIIAKWRYMFGGQMNVPLVIRCVIGRSWGQGAQHSQSLQSMFMHVPGIQVVMPTTPYDAKGYLLSSIFSPDPVVIIEHRLLYFLSGEVPEGYYEIPFGQTFKRREGKDITIVANSYMVAEALQAAAFLAENGIEVEILDPVSLAPLNEKPIVESVQKTGKLLIVDCGWTTCGASAEIAARVGTQAFQSLKAPIERMGTEPTPCPVTKPLEHAFYPDAPKIVQKICQMLGKTLPNTEVPMLQTKFKGPF